MNIEYEATFTNIEKDDIRERLKTAGAVLVRPEYLQRRIPFFLPNKEDAENSWLRVRDEGDKVTLSLKTIDGKNIENQKELCLEVNSFNDAVELLESIGCVRKSYQESKRELWTLDGVEITLDEWPFLEPFVEVEGKSEDSVRVVSEKLGFDYSKALFCAVGDLYVLKYGIHPDKINTLDKLIFDMPNPFVS
ncbi:MAG: CYTH domain-containing protein [Candidatus Moraniibacteriota bacterium]|nr:MAG: CYTH domain-containing protein [Candidatus Moranbacteria bacterium]